MDAPNIIENNKLKKHKQKVISTIQETGILIPLLDTQEKYEEYIKNLSHDQLRFLYRTLWSWGSHSTFAERYNINAGNFSKWLANKKGSPTSAEAVRRFLIEGPPGKNLNKTIPIIPPPKEIIIPQKEIIYYNLSQALDHIKNSFPFSFFFVIDGDHAAYKIFEIAPLADIFNIHAVVCTARNSIPSSLISFSYEKWVTICRSETTSKDAADSLMHSVTLLTYSLYLKANNIPIILVSGDEIFIEFKADLSLLNHPTYSPSISLPLGGWFLLDNSIPIPSELKTLRGTFNILLFQITSNLKAPTISELIEDTNLIFKDKIENLNINFPVPIKDIVTAYILFHEFKYYPTFIDIENLSSDELRFEYLNRYKNNISTFSSKYGINKGDFSSWIYRRLLFSEESENAVRKWLMETS